MKPNPETTPQDRFFTAAAILLELLTSIITSETAKLIGRRIAMIAEGGWLPGFGDVRLIAGLTNRSDRSIEEITGSTHRPKYKVGRQTMYRLADFATSAREPRTPK